MSSFDILVLEVKRCLEISVFEMDLDPEHSSLVVSRPCNRFARLLSLKAIEFHPR